MSKHEGEKWGKLCISSTRSSIRGLTPTKNWPKIDKTPTWSKVNENKVIYKFSIEYVKRMLQKSEEIKTVYFQYSKDKKEEILSSERGITPTKIVESCWHSNLIWSSLYDSYMQNFNSICQNM